MFKCVLFSLNFWYYLKIVNNRLYRRCCSLQLNMLCDWPENVNCTAKSRSSSARSRQLLHWPEPERPTRSTVPTRWFNVMINEKTTPPPLAVNHPLLYASYPSTTPPIVSSSDRNGPKTYLLRTKRIWMRLRQSFRQNISNSRYGWTRSL